MQHVGVSLADAVTHLRHGRWRAAAKVLFNRRMLESAGSVLEGFGWISRL